jgi:hypothetical protein
LVPLDRSDIATPSGTGSFFFKVDFVSNFVFFGPWLVVFAVSESRLSERPGLISYAAQRGVDSALPHCVSTKQSRPPPQA